MKAGTLHMHSCECRPQAFFLLALGVRWLDTPSAILPLLLFVSPLNAGASGGGYAVNHLGACASLEPSRPSE